MIEERFSKGDSIIHKLDPRIKIIYAFLFSIIMAVSANPLVLTSGFVFSLALVFLARLEFKEILKRLFLVNIFILLLWLILPLSVPGKLLFSIWKLHITQEGIIYAFQITVRCNTIVLAIIAFLSTSSILNLTYALKSLRIPDKMVYLFFLIYRYIFTLLKEYRRLENALKIRGFIPKTSLQTYRVYAYLTGTLLIRSYDRAEQIYRAMLCRGFTGKFWVLNKNSFKKTDILSIGIFGIYITLLLFLQWMKSS